MRCSKQRAARNSRKLLLHCLACSRCVVACLQESRKARRGGPYAWLRSSFSASRLPRSGILRSSRSVDQSGASVPGPLQGNPGRYRRLSDGALPLRRTQTRGGGPGGFAGRLDLVELPCPCRAGRCTALPKHGGAVRAVRRAHAGAGQRSADAGVGHPARPVAAGAELVAVPGALRRPPPRPAAAQGARARRVVDVDNGAGNQAVAVAGEPKHCGGGGYSGARGSKRQDLPWGAARPAILSRSFTYTPGNLILFIVSTCRHWVFQVWPVDCFFYFNCSSCCCPNSTRTITCERLTYSRSLPLPFWWPA